MLSSAHTSPEIPLKAVKPRNLVNGDRFGRNKMELTDYSGQLCRGVSGWDDVSAGLRIYACTHLV